MDPVTIAALVAGGVSLAATATSGIATGKLNKKNREWQEKMHNIQRQESLADIESARAYQNQLIADDRAYNSPESQVERLRDAGLNPSLAYGQGIDAGNYNIGSPDVASPSGTPVSSGNIAPDFSSLGNFQAVIPAIMNAEANQRNASTAEFRADFDRNLSQAQVLKYLSERDYIDKKTYGEMLENLYRESTMGKRIELLKNEVDSVAQTILESKQRIAESLSRINVNEKQAAKISADIDFVNQSLNNLKLVADQIKAETFKTWESGKTEVLKRENLSSDTSLKEASVLLTESRRRLTDLETELKRLDIPKAEVDAFLAPIRSASEILGNIFSIVKK